MFLDSCSVKGKTIPRMWLISVSIPHGLPSIISNKLSKPTSPRSPSQTFDIDYQQSVAMCGIPIHGNLLRLRSRYVRLCAFHHDFWQHRASTMLKKQLRKPWRRNQTKRDGSLGRKWILFTAWNKQARYAAVRHWSWINEMRRNPLRYQCA